MSQLLLTGLTHPGTFELEPGFNTLGRNPTNDFRVHDVTVSSFHCEIVVSEGSVLVRDLGSTNGTYIEGQPIQEAPLSPGQILRLGSADLRQTVRRLASIPIEVFFTERFVQLAKPGGMIALIVASVVAYSFLATQGTSIGIARNIKAHARARYAPRKPAIPR